MKIRDKLRQGHHFTNDNVTSQVQRERTVLNTIQRRKLQLFG